MIFYSSEVTVEGSQGEPGSVVRLERTAWVSERLTGGSGGGMGASMCRVLCRERAGGQCGERTAGELDSTAAVSVLAVPRTGWELSGKLPAFSVPAFVHLHQVTDTCLIVRIKGGAVCIVLYYYRY